MQAHVISSAPALSPLRISAWSSTLALHLAAFALLVLPSQVPLPTPPVEKPVTLQADIVRAELVRQLPVPPVPPPPTRPPPPRPTPARETLVPVILAESALPVAVTIAPVEEFSAEVESAPAPVSRGAQIAYDHAPPPPYPSLARRRGWEGEVLLRVRVDTDGRPREVLVERSSGRALFDRAASEHVLVRWRFQPALQDGRAVGAWAIVPISFRLERG